MHFEISPVKWRTFCLALSVFMASITVPARVSNILTRTDTIRTFSNNTVCRVYDTFTNKHECRCRYMHVKRHTGSWYNIYMCWCNLNWIYRDPLQWRHNKRNRASNHRRLDCFRSRLLRRRSKRTPNLPVTGLYEGNPPVTGVTGGFPSQRASNAENISIWWHHDVIMHWSSLKNNGNLGQSLTTTKHNKAWPVAIGFWSHNSNVSRCRFVSTSVDLTVKSMVHLVNYHPPRDMKIVWHERNDLSYHRPFNCSTVCAGDPWIPLTKYQ